MVLATDLNPYIEIGDFFLEILAIRNLKRHLILALQIFISLFGYR